MPLDKRKVQRALRKIGFQVRNHHHIFHVYVTLAGIEIAVRTHVSHSGKTLNADLENKMARQIGLNRTQFIRLVNGDMSREEYEKILREKGLLPPR